MPNCRFHEICGLDDTADPEAGLCILHSQASEKDKSYFKSALDAYKFRGGANFSGFVFPTAADFSGVTFDREVRFEDAIFRDEADFGTAEFRDQAVFTGTLFNGEAFFAETTFRKGAFFSGAVFAKGAIFGQADFTEEAHFTSVRFNEEADFTTAQFVARGLFDAVVFTGRAKFFNTSFLGGAVFSGAKFLDGADFEETRFKIWASFRSASFRQRTLFAAKQDRSITMPIFVGVEVDFTNVLIDPPDALTFLEADFRRCRFQDTDLRGVSIIGAMWPRIPGWLEDRIGIYDEIGPLEPGLDMPWVRIERVYRELKQNYEDRRDYERAGDFHYGEKEMRRQNPETRLDLKVLLGLYRLAGGYGESFLPPLFWLVVLLLGSAAGYLYFGLLPSGGKLLLSLAGWKQVLLYSLRVMTLLRPDDLTPLGYGKLINTGQSLLGPVLIGLMALAVRQRLKR
jgi:uncharacterized protein YjbI with pentapeptide repeats